MIRNLLFASLLTSLLVPAVPGSAQSSIVDSLERKFENARPGYDQVDYLSGIIREYMLARDSAHWYSTADRLDSIALEHNSPEGTIYSLIFRSIAKWSLEGDVNSAFLMTEEALSKSQFGVNHDVLLFAAYQHAENMIWEKGDINGGMKILKQFMLATGNRAGPKNIGNVLKNIGFCYKALGHLDSAIVSYTSALDQFDIVAEGEYVDPVLGRTPAMYADKGISNKGQTLNYLAQAHQASGRFEEAVEVWSLALDLYEKYDQTDQLAWVHMVMAEGYQLQGNLAMAIENFNTAKTLFDQLGTDRDIASINRSLGMVFNELQEYGEARQYFTDAMDYYAKRSDSARVLALHINLSLAATGLEEYDLAKEHLEEALALSIALEAVDRHSEVLEGLARIAQHKGQSELALNYQIRGIELARANNNRLQESQSLLNLARLLESQGEYTKALDNSKSSLEIAQEIEVAHLERANHQLLDNLYSKLGDYESAYVHLGAYSGMQEALSNERAQTLLREEQVRQNISRFETEKANAELQTQLLQRRNQLYAFAIIAFVLFIIGILYAYVQLRKIKKQLEVQNVQLKELNATKDKFFGIIAHDIRSPIVALETLGTQMRYYLESEKFDKVVDLTENFDSTTKSLNNLLDNLLNWALLQTGAIAFRPENIDVRKVADHNLSLFDTLAATKNVSLVNEIEEGCMVFADDSSVRTIVRNLVSNALKFTPVGGRVHLSSVSENGRTMIKIQDNGVGMTPEQVADLYALDKRSQKGTEGERGTGLGLTLCHEMVTKNRGSLVVDSTLGVGSTFTVTLPTGTQPTD